MKTSPLCLIASLLLAAPAARAQESEGESISGRTYESAMSIDSVRSKVEDWQIMPPGNYEIGANLAFLTSEPMLGGSELRFTDVVLLRVSGRTSIKGKVEVFGGADLLVKQPSFTDESLWQSTSLGARAKVMKKTTAALQLGTGTLIDRAGYVGGAELTLQRKWSPDETLSFEVAGGGSWTGLRRHDADNPAWLSEVVARGEAMVRAPNHIAGAWLGFEFCVPVAHHQTNAMPLDPQTRVNFHVGFVYAIVDDLDLFAELAVLDRGDLAEPATTLPVLDGGFDQRQMIFGLVRRFPNDKDEDGRDRNGAWQTY